MATLYASGSNWNTASHWGTTSGASDGSVPTASDAAIFDANSVDMSLSAAGVCASIDTTAYTGTLSKGAYDLTVGGAVLVAGGALTNGSGTLQAATLAMSSGTINNGTGTIRIRGTSATPLTFSGGTFNRDTGLLWMDSTGNGQTYDFNSVDLYDLKITSGSVSSDTVSNGPTVKHDIEIGDHDRIVGTIYFEGDMTITGGGISRVCNSEFIATGASGDQTISTVGAAGAITGLTVNKASGNLVFDTSGGQLSILLTAARTLTETSGSFDFTTNSANVLISINGTSGIAISDGIIFHDLQFEGSGNPSCPIGGGSGSLTVNGNLVFGATCVSNYRLTSTGKINLKGNLTVNALATGVHNSTIGIELNGTGTQTVTQNTGGRLTAGTFTINKSSGSAVLAAALAASVTGQDVSLTQGTLDLAGYNLTANDVFSVASGATLKMKGNETITAATKTYNANMTLEYYDAAVTAVVGNFGTTLPNVKFFGGKTHNFTASGTFTSAGTWEVSGGTGQAILRSTSDGTKWNLNFTGTNSLGANVDVKDSDATPGNPMLVFGSASSGNNTDWLFVPIPNFKEELETIVFAGD